MRKVSIASELLRKLGCPQKPAPVVPGKPGESPPVDRRGPEPDEKRRPDLWQKASPGRL